MFLPVYKPLDDEIYLIRGIGVQSFWHFVHGCHLVHRPLQRQRERPERDVSCGGGHPAGPCVWSTEGLPAWKRASVRQRRSDLHERVRHVDNRHSERRQAEKDPRRAVQKKRYRLRFCHIFCLWRSKNDTQKTKIASRLKQIPLVNGILKICVDKRYSNLQGWVINQLHTSR